MLYASRQRRLRRPRRASRRPRTTARWCPISTYGASKLAGEALLASYAAMFDFTVRAFRFGNVVGPQPDPRRRLRLRPPAARRPDPAAHPRRRQAEQVLHPRRRTSSTPCCWRAPLADTPFDAFNVATGDYVTVTEIAELAMRGARASSRARRAFEYTGGDRGWKGDVPVVRIATAKIRALGWANQPHRARGAARLDGRRWPTRPARGCSARDAVMTRAPRAVFLDRDGVLNRAFVEDGVPVPPRTRRRTSSCCPGVVEACAAFADAGPRPGGGHQPARPRPRRPGPGRARRDAPAAARRAAARRRRRVPARRPRRLLVPQAAARG